MIFAEFCHTLQQISNLWPEVLVASSAISTQVKDVRSSLLWLTSEHAYLDKSRLSNDDKTANVTLHSSRISRHCSPASRHMVVYLLPSRTDTCADARILRKLVSLSINECCVSILQIPQYTVTHLATKASDVHVSQRPGFACMSVRRAHLNLHALHLVSHAGSSVCVNQLHHNVALALGQ